MFHILPHRKRRISRRCRWGPYCPITRGFVWKMCKSKFSRFITLFLSEVNTQTNTHILRSTEGKECVLRSPTSLCVLSFDWALFTRIHTHVYTHFVLFMPFYLELFRFFMVWLLFFLYFYVAIFERKGIKGFSGDFLDFGKRNFPLGVSHNSFSQRDGIVSLWCGYPLACFITSLFLCYFPTLVSVYSTWFWAELKLNDPKRNVAVAG